MTGLFQIKKQLDGGVQELLGMKSKVVLNVNDPVTLDTDGTIVKYASGDALLGVNNSEMVAPEFYNQADLDAIATTAVETLINPAKENTMIEVVPAVAITTQAAIDALIGYKADFDANLKLVTTAAGTDAQIVDFIKYTAKDGTLTFNPIVKALIRTY